MKGYLLFSFLLASCFSDSIFRRQLLQQPEAVCLDGSPGAYYISLGIGVNRKKMLIYFEGGGWCGGIDLASTLESCYQRTFTDLGSSKDYPETLDLVAGGILSGDADMNPLFSSWTRVLIKYCDGTIYQSYKSASVSYKGTSLFFRGEQIAVNVLFSLDATYGLFTTFDNILVTGSGAGGLAAIQWGDQVFAASQGKVWAAPDSGILLDSLNIKTGTYALREQLINIMKFNDKADPLVPNCAQKYPTELWRCMLPQYLYQFVQVPLFPVNSLYDTQSINNVLGITCIDSSGSLKDCSDSDRHSINDYKRNMTDLIIKIAAVKGNGAWGIACAGTNYLHSRALNNPKFTVPGGSSYTVSFSVASWVVGSKQNTYIDSVDWPNNKACAGTTLSANTP